ncbi:hypothetical protein UCDDS831_g07607 [Diplodia seriata]|uniref:Uncharacterized protein n=1 Tax=Diplodia seriata TaxID=420778 RepID=A0A0G2DXS0_9PEZI|nr:hypothetical protein UCDDS831_g07607 [Diplodia seriata]
MEAPNANGPWDHAGKAATLNAQVTYWSRSNGSDWDALILTDPCVQDPAILAMLSGEAEPPAELQKVVCYADFEDPLDLPAVDPGEWTPKHPPCTAFVLYEDLLQHFALLGADEADHLGGSACTPPVALLTGFVRGFVVNKWIAYLNHAHGTFLALRNRLFAPGHNTAAAAAAAAAQDHHHPRYSAKWGGVWEEWMFERMAAFVLELSLFRADLECDMRELGLDPDDHAPSPSGSCCGCRGVVGRREGQMWRYVRDQLECTKADYKDLIEMYTKVLSLRESQMSNRLNRSVGRLTLLGACFVPASIIASILSMGETFD